MAKVYVHVPGNEIDIQDLWVFLSVDSEGRKGIVASVLPNFGSAPMVTGSENLVAAMKDEAEKIAQLTGQPIELYRFRRDQEPLWRTP
jgi:hypothetical protein